MAETVVFIHGLYMVGLEFAALRFRVKRAGFETRRFHYSSLWRGIEDNARKLGIYLQALPAERLHLVAHSLGGLVVLQMFQQGVRLPPGRVVLLGSPIRGSRAAAYLTEKGLAWSLGKAGPGGLAGTYQPRWTEPRELGVVAGTHEFAINPMNFGLVSPHDGMVSVEETRIEGAKDSVTIHANHTGMLFTRELAEQVTAFLQAGHFRHSSRVR
ncbi:MAG TPA: alpha/beta fold hydrolase [Gammaproteobacteria bacterium]|nr:alpha/beta fold hydrolase [Gammaproteobacteria bacterium]